MRFPTSARFNIVTAALSKLAAMGVAVLTVPLLLGLLGQQTYGIWVTLTSMVAFIGLLDLGVGNSLRNSVAAMGEQISADVQAEFVVAFRLLCRVGMITIAALGVTLTWPNAFSEHLGPAALLYAPIVLSLPLLLGNSVLQGAKATGLQSMIQTAGNCAFLALVGALVWTHHVPSLSELAMIWSGCYVLTLAVTFAISLGVLRMKTHHLLDRTSTCAPTGRLRVGIEFLILQLTSLVLFNLGNLLIFQKLGADEVARYDVLNKIFQVSLSLFTIIIGVMWTEIARHRAVSNVEAMRRVFFRLSVTAGGFSTMALGGAHFAPWIVDNWTGHRLQVTTGEAYALAVLVSIQSIAYVGAVFMNAFERVRPQIVIAVVSTGLIVPISTHLMERGMGITAVPITAGGLTLVAAIFCNIYTLRLIRDLNKDEATPR